VDLALRLLEPVRAGETVSFRPPAWDERRREGAIVVPSGTERIHLTSDCGLFAYSRPAAKAKLRAMVKGAELARQELQAGASGAAARTQSP
jgi:hypothetical protein